MFHKSQRYYFIYGDILHYHQLGNIFFFQHLQRENCHQINKPNWVVECYPTVGV